MNHIRSEQSDEGEKTEADYTSSYSPLTAYKRFLSGTYPNLCPSAVGQSVDTDNTTGPSTRIPFFLARANLQWLSRWSYHNPCEATNARLPEWGNQERTY